MARLFTRKKEYLMLIELTSKPWKESADSYPTVDATIDGKKDQFVQKHPDGSLWMSEMQASNQGTFVAFTPIPEDAMVIDLVNENCLGTVAKKAHELAEAGGNIDRDIRETLLMTAKSCPDFEYNDDVYRYIEREVNEIVQNEMTENPTVKGNIVVDGVDVHIHGMDMSLKEVRNYVCAVKENQCNFDSVLHTLDIAPEKNKTMEDGISLDYTIGHPKFERIRRITGYLVGTVDRWNNAKRAEEHDRVKHGLAAAHR